jgi:hypothetical protein
MWIKYRLLQQIDVKMEKISIGDRHKGCDLVKVRIIKI